MLFTLFPKPVQKEQQHSDLEPNLTSPSSQDRIHPLRNTNSFQALIEISFRGKEVPLGLAERYLYNLLINGF